MPDVNDTNTDDVQTDSTKALSLEEQQSRIWDAWRSMFPMERPVPEPIDAYIAEMFDDHIIVEYHGEHWSVPYTEDEDVVTFAPREEWQKVKQERNWVNTKNALKAISWDDDHLRAGNYIVLFEGRDLEGIKPGTTEIEWTNEDGSQGEYFTKATDLESAYTATGRVMIDMEHGQARSRYGKDAPGPDDILGYVDWSTKRIDDQGVWVERVLDTHNWYMQWIGDLIKAGIVGTSSEAVDGEVQKATDGQIVRWPLRRDSLTITPMEWRNKGENVIQAFKALGLVPDDNEAEQEQEQETPPEADKAAVVASAKARLQRFRISLLEEQ